MQAPPTIWGIQPRTDAEKLFTSLYIKQTKDLWDTPEATALLMEIAHTIPKVDADTIPRVDNTERTLDVVRFVYLDNTPALMSLVPGQMLHKSNNSDQDPIPPDHNIFSYPAQRSALEGHAHGFRFAEDVNPIAALHRLMPNFRGAPRGADDEFSDDEPNEEEIEYMEAMQRALDGDADSDEEVPRVPPPGIARRLLQMFWMSSVRAGEEEDDQNDESDAATDTDDEMPDLIGESDGERPGLVDMEESDDNMPGLVNIDDERPALVPIDSDHETASLDGNNVPGPLD